MRTRRGRKPHPKQPYYIEREKLRAVWAYVTRNPRARFDEIALGTGLKRAVCVQGLRVLIAAGYVEAPPRARAARRIIIPLITLGEGARVIKRNSTTHVQ